MQIEFDSDFEWLIVAMAADADDDDDNVHILLGMAPR